MCLLKLNTSLSVSCHQKHEASLCLCLLQLQQPLLGRVLLSLCLSAMLSMYVGCVKITYLDTEHSVEEYYPVRLPGLEFLLCPSLRCNLGWVFQLPFLEPHSLLFTLILNCVYFIKHTEVLSEIRHVINNKGKLTFYIDFVSGHLHELLFCVVLDF